MKQACQKLLGKALRSIEAAERELGYGDLEFAASRAYYAMFYVAEALLYEKGLKFRKHGAVHGAFGEHFIKTHILDPKFHQWILRAFEKRLSGDYEIDSVLTAEEVKDMIPQSKELLQVARQYLSQSV